MKIRSILGGLALIVMTASCVSPKKAFPAAALRSGCKPDAIEVVKHDGKNVVLSVCGVYEDWKWHPLAGWEYVGPSSEQPLKQTMDGDADGVPDDVDACPKQAGVSALEPQKNGCPMEADSDRDGIANNEDACPTELGIKQPDAKKNGCPPDGDGDGVGDNKDACPGKAGPASSDPKTSGCPAPDGDNDGVPDAEDGCAEVAGDPQNKGCPADKDSDNIPDASDACPEAAGVASDDTTKNGCPEEASKPDTKTKAPEGKPKTDAKPKAPETKAPEAK
jgi:hypothetical protein